MFLHSQIDPKKTPHFMVRGSCRKTLPHRRSVLYMIEHNDENKKSPKELKTVFNELEILKAPSAYQYQKEHGVYLFLSLSPRM
jgi:hypothetical protein